jgi:hypothetical protein
VRDAVHADQRLAHGVAVADVAHHQLDVLGR